MSFASIQSQQFGVTSVYSFTGSHSESGWKNVITEPLPEGKYIYQISMVINTTDSLKESLIRVNDGTIETNLWKYDITAQSHFVDMTGIWVADNNSLHVQIYQSTTTINATYTLSGTLTCLKIV